MQSLRSEAHRAIYAGQGSDPSLCLRSWKTIYGEPNCIAFGGLRVDDVVEAALLTVVQFTAVQAARSAEPQAAVQRDEARDALVRDLEAARYAADWAFRNMTRPIPRTASSLVSWRLAGIVLSPAWPSSRSGLPSMTRHSLGSTSHRSPSPYWPRTCRLSGQHRQRLRIREAMADLMTDRAGGGNSRPDIGPWGLAARQQRGSLAVLYVRRQRE